MFRNVCTILHQTWEFTEFWLQDHWRLPSPTLLPLSLPGIRTRVDVTPARFSCACDVKIREVESTNWSLWSAKTSRIPPSKKWNFERDLLRKWQDSVWDSIVWNHQPDPTDRWLETLRHTHARENAGCTWECKKRDTRTPCLFSCLPKRYRRVFSSYCFVEIEKWG